MVDSCRTSGFTDIVVVHEHRGEPDGLVVCHLPFGPTAYFGLLNCVARHDIKDTQLGTMSEAYPHLVLEARARARVQPPGRPLTRAHITRSPGLHVHAGRAGEQHPQVPLSRAQG